MESPAPAHELSAHLWCIDTQQLRPQMAACYLVGDGQHYAFVDTGTNAGVPAVLALLQALGIEREQISHVIPTHVHLDHAGGAGLLVQSLPQARLLIHPRGARHMVDPAALWQGVVGVYGETAAQQMYGELVPVPEDRVIVAEDGDDVLVGQRRLTVLDSPGHARHHLSLWDETSRGWFSGDTFGFSYRETDGPYGAMVLPTTTPVQFDPDAWQRTLDAYLARRPECMYLTHFGRIEAVAERAAELRQAIADYASIARSLCNAEERQAAIADALKAHAMGLAARKAVPLAEPSLESLLEHDLRLNAQGLDVWLQRAA